MSGKVVLLDSYFDARGFLDDQGEPNAAARIYFTSINSARLAATRLSEHLKARGVRGETLESYQRRTTPMAAKSLPPDIGLTEACEDRRLLNLRLSEKQREFLELIEGNQTVIGAGGRQGGKTLMVASALVHNMTLSPLLDEMSRGTTRFGLAIANSKEQASILLSYARRLIESSPLLRRSTVVHAVRQAGLEERACVARDALPRQAAQRSGHVDGLLGRIRSLLGFRWIPGAGRPRVCGRSSFSHHLRAGGPAGGDLHTTRLRQSLCPAPCKGSVWRTSTRRSLHRDQ